MAGFSKKKYFALAKGFYGRAKNCLRITIPKVEKGLCKAYIGRKQRPRILRTNWIMAINTGVKDLDLSYSRFIYGLNHSNIMLNRKILADLVVNEPYSFKAVVDEVRIQNGLLEKRSKYTLEDMIKKNLLTAATLKKEDYTTMDQPGVKLRYKGV